MAIQQFKYTMEMQYIDTATSTPTTIEVASIKSLIIDSEYDVNNMPMVFATLTLDKNLIDDMLMNYSKNLINMTIYKFISNASQIVKEVYVREQFNYFISGDINTNKDIDYSSDDDKKRKDIYKTINIGMIKKQSIDDNKKSFNTSVKDTTMINLVNMCTKHIQILIEKFTYNDNIPQLIVPPMDSVVKTLKFLNSIRVFYSTQYRYFMDFDSTYLISSSGSPVVKKGENYSTIVINIRPVNDPQANNVGMVENKNDKCYIIDVNIADTNYSINRATEHSVNGMAAALDSSKEKSKPNTAGMRQSISDASIFKSKLDTLIDDKIPNILSTYDTARALTENFSLNNNKLTVVKSTIDTAYSAITSILAALPVEPVPNIISASAPTVVYCPVDMLTSIRSNMANVTNAHSIVNTVPNVYAPICADVTSSMNHLLDVPSHVNGITVINLKDNLHPMESLSKNVASNTASAIDKISTQLEPITPHATTMETNLNNMITSLESNHAINDLIKTQLSILKTANSNMGGILNEIVGDIGKTISMPPAISNINTQVKASLEKIAAIPNDLKAQFTSVGNRLSSFSGAISNVKNAIATGLSSGNISNIGLSLDSLNDIKKDLAGIKDLSNIGGLGVTKLDVDLSLGDVDASEKKKVVRVNNDNANMIKNIKAKVESNSALLSINKNDLDSSILTINKEYIINNAEAHSDKNGRFLLSRKREIFIREDENFVLNVMLDFKILKS